MSIENTRYAVVNLSTTKIPVYEKLVHSSVHTGSVTVGGNVIGHIHQYEFYTVIPNDSNYITSHKIMFLDGNFKQISQLSFHRLANGDKSWFSRRFRHLSYREKLRITLRPSAQLSVQK